MKPNTSNSQFLSLYLNTFVSPKNSLSRVLKHEKSLIYGLISLLVPAFGYTFFYIMAYKSGGSPSVFKPWLALPIEYYFYYDIFLTIPGYIVSFLTAGGLIHLLSKVMGAKGTYENTLTMLGFAIGVASWSAMAHDLSDAFLGFLGIIDMREYEKALNSPTVWRTIWLIFYTGYFIWMPVILSIGLRLSLRLSRLNSAILSLVGFVVFQVILLIFIR